MCSCRYIGHIYWQNKFFEIFFLANQIGVGRQDPFRSANVGHNLGAVLHRQRRHHLPGIESASDRRPELEGPFRLCLVDVKPAPEVDGVIVRRAQEVHDGGQLLRQVARKGLSG